MPVLGSSADLARLDSPAFQGNPTAPTPASGDSDTSIATTAFVAAAVAAGGGGGGGATGTTVVAAPSGSASTDYTNITAAITAVASAGGIVQLQPGAYLTTQTIVVPGGVMLRGTGIDYAQTAAVPARASIIRASSAISGPVVQVGDYWDGTFGAANYVSGHPGAQIVDLVVDGANTASYAVQLYGPRCYVRNCQIFRGTTYALYFTGQNSYVMDSVIGNDNQGTTVYISGYDNKVMRCQIRGHGSSGSGVQIAGGEGTVVEGCHIFPDFAGITPGGPDILIAGGTKITIANNDLDQTSNHQLKITGGGFVTVTGNLIRMYTSADNTYDAVHCDTTVGGVPIKGVTVVGNNIIGGDATHRYRSILGRAGSQAVIGRLIGNHGEFVASVFNNLTGLSHLGNSAFSGTTTTYGDKAGTATFSGTGSQTAFTIAHGLYTTPATFGVVAQSAAAAAPFYVTADATNLTVTYTTAPASGTSNVVLNWHAEV